MTHDPKPANAPAETRKRGVRPRNPNKTGPLDPARGPTAPHAWDRFGPALAEGWRRRGMTEPTAIQRKALRRLEAEGPGRARNWLVLAPTGAGKTGAAEVAMADALARGRKAVYLVPTRALAEEKAREFAAWLAPAGLRVACATRERPESDAIVAAGAYELLVAVYEKMDHQLSAPLGDQVPPGCVVVDEIQMIGDEERGGGLDLTLTRLLISPHPSRLVGLAAAMPPAGARAMAQWMEAELIADGGRPLPLREGVLDFGTGNFAHRGGPEDGSEALADLEEIAAARRDIGGAWAESDLERGGAGRGEPEPEILDAAAATLMLARRGESTLLFAPTRALSRDLARAIAAALPESAGSGPSRARALEIEPGRSRELLIELLARGVAAHNADLDERARALVEEGFNGGDIRVVVATATLGMGVNLAGRNVVQIPWRYARAGGVGRPARAPLGRARCANQGGRAGRPGMGDAEFGRSILVAADAERAAALWAELIAPEPEPVTSALGLMPLEAAALKLMGGGTARSARNLKAALDASFCGAGALVCGAGDCARAAGEGWSSERRVEGALRELERLGLVKRDAGCGFYALTGLGETAARTGISPATAPALLRALRRPEIASPASGFHGAEWRRDVLLTLALAPEARAALAAGALAAPRADAEDDNENLSPLEAELAAQPGGPSFGERRAALAARALAEWIGPAPTAEFESRWGVHQGGFARVAAEFQWLARAMASLARRSDADRAGAELAEALGELAERLGPGFGPGGVGLARLRIAGLGRDAAAALVEAGLASPEAIAEAPTARLVDLVGWELAERIERAAHETLTARTEPSRPRAMTAPALSRPAINAGANRSPKRARSLGAEAEAGRPFNPDDLTLAINLRSPGVIQAAGAEVRLTPMCFELLAALAERPGEVVTRQSLYHRLWPEGGAEEQQLDGHRRKLIARLRPALGAAASAAAEVIRGVGFRLAWPGERVELTR